MPFSEFWKLLGGRSDKLPQQPDIGYRDIANATPEVLQEIREGYLEKYHTAEPLERPDALELLGVYGEHFFKTATPEERATLAIAIGRTPLEYEIMGEGFSLRELMKSLGST